MLEGRDTVTGTELTVKERDKIRLLSDGKLYDDAIRVAGEHEEVIAYGEFGHQVNGLDEHADSFRDLDAFVTHQRERDWTGRSQSFEGFYTTLARYLSELRDLVQDEYGFVPEGLTKNDRRQQKDVFAGLLAREFVRHLAAEMMWQAWQKEGKR